jgi:hypothetical protein
MIRRLIFTGASVAMGLAGSLGLTALTTGVTPVSAATTSSQWGCHRDWDCQNRRCDWRWGGCDDRGHHDWSNRNWGHRDRDWNDRCQWWW